MTLAFFYRAFGAFVDVLARSSASTRSSASSELAVARARGRVAPSSSPRRASPRIAIRAGNDTLCAEPHSSARVVDTRPFANAVEHGELGRPLRRLPSPVLRRHRGIVQARARRGTRTRRERWIGERDADAHGRAEEDYERNGATVESDGDDGVDREERYVEGATVMWMRDETLV